MTDEEHTLVKKAWGRKRFTPKDCYFNAWKLGVEIYDHEPEADLAYVAGKYHEPSFPNAAIDHAWVSLNGKVIGPTLKVLGDYPEDAYGYIGVLFDIRWVAEQIAATPAGYPQLLNYIEGIVLGQREPPTQAASR